MRIAVAVAVAVAEQDPRTCVGPCYLDAALGPAGGQRLWLGLSPVHLRLVVHCNCAH